MRIVQKATIAVLLCFLESSCTLRALTPDKAIFVAMGEGPDNATVSRAVSAVVDKLQATNHHLASSPDATHFILTVACFDRPSAPNGKVYLDHVVRLTLNVPGQSTPIWTVQERGPYPVFQLRDDGANWGKDFSKVAAKLVADIHTAQTKGSIPADF